MTKQEQIKEIQEIIDNCWEFDSINAELGSGDGYINTQKSAETLYNAGYRKIDENCAVITKDELKEYKRQAVKAFAERLKKDPRINNYGLEFVALVDIDAELKALLKEYEK